jgi:hypothetical protein
MPHKFFTGKYGIAILAFGFAVLAGPAHAGFQWVAPPEAGGGFAMPGAPSGGPATTGPVVITGDNGPMVETAPSSSSAYSSFQAPVVVGAAPGSEDHDLATATIEAPAVSSSSSSSCCDVVQGFATEVPLALALRQVLPQGTNFSIDQNIDMDTVVSYKGGKSWRETVRQMLGPVGLVAREQGSTLIVSHAGTVSASSLAPAASSGATTVAVPTSKGPVVDSGPGGSMPSTGSGGGRRIATTVHSNTIQAAMTPSYNVSSPDGWSAQRGDTLRKVLSEWCRRGGIELQWLAEYDYPMEASVHFSGGFEDAVRALLAGFENAHPQPVAELHANPNAGQRILVVQARGNNYSN